MVMYPEWAVCHSNFAIGNGNCVLDTPGCHVAARVCPIAVILDLNLHCLVVHIHALDVESCLSCWASVHCELSPLVNNYACLLQTGTFGNDLWDQNYKIINTNNFFQQIKTTWSHVSTSSIKRIYLSLHFKFYYTNFSCHTKSSWFISKESVEVPIQLKLLKSTFRFRLAYCKLSPLILLGVQARSIYFINVIFWSQIGFRQPKRKDALMGDVHLHYACPTTNKKIMRKMLECYMPIVLWNCLWP